MATLNTMGVPLFGSRLAARYGVIADSFEAADVDVVCFQEVLSYYHLRLLARRMPSFRHVSFHPSAAGPAGGLVTMSRLPATRPGYHRFPVPSAAAGLTRARRFAAPLKGVLVTGLAARRVYVVNTHPMSNRDGDWTESNRFFALHQGQLAALARVVSGLTWPTVVGGDFNVARDSVLFRDFIARTGLADAFGGRCPPTFRAEYLDPGESPHCIDFICVSSPLQVADTDLLLTAKQPLPGGPGYASDHIGLRVRVVSPGKGR